MCGIAGFWGGAQFGDAKKICQNMMRKLDHRGPDYLGIWVQDNLNIALGHKRLSIQDLSSAGNQPMISYCERYRITFNGEIYNHLNIRKTIEAFGCKPSWRGHSDTETLLAAITVWGLEGALKKCVGMFAFVIWDQKEQKLILARDRMGEKPLYYGWHNEVFLFGSELKALKAHPAFINEIDRDSLSLLLRYNNIPSPHSIYKNIFKLPPANILILNPRNKDFSMKPYWDFKCIAESGVISPFNGTDQDAIIGLENVLSQSIKEQMLADVPLGSFLSGGIDSSLIVALMQAQSSQAVKTFTIGFNEEGYNEAKYAKEIAKYLGTEHTELYVTPNEAQNVILSLPEMFDEPFADSSQIPTYLVSKLAKQNVTVSLSGDGGDELFAGYNRHYWSKPIWNKIKHLPLGVRKIAALSILSISPDSWDKLVQKFHMFIPERYQVMRMGEKLHKLAEVLPVDSPESMYRNLISQWKNPENIVLGSREPIISLTDKSQWANLSNFEDIMMYLDTVSYLPDDILTKVDRAAMSVSLETRVPMLDYRVVEFAWKLPLHLKIRENHGKWLLRQLLFKYVPKELIERPKMGFGVPIDFWLRGSLRDWAESLLDSSRLSREGYFNEKIVRRIWNDHISGKRNYQHQLWSILMFQSWMESNK